MKHLKRIRKISVKFIRKIPRINTRVFAVLCSLLLFAFFSRPTPGKNEIVKASYLNQLNTLEKTLRDFKSVCREPTSMTALRKKFLTCRLVYKKMSPVTDYFNIYETKKLNGPNLPRVEEDNPQTIIEPGGFQVVEEILYTGADKPDYTRLKTETEGLLEICQQLKTETDLVYKFKDYAVFDALRSSVLRLITLGITGFDSPIAQHSLPEAKATLEGIEIILNIYRQELNQKAPDTYQLITRTISGAKQYLNTHRDFDQFDRAFFITKYANPVYGDLVAAASSLSFTLPDERRPVNVKVKSIFDTGAFNMDFYAPNERYRPTEERIALGKKLFYDPMLSGTGTRSCASCHQPEKAFTDGLKTALSADEKSFLLRNTPTLWNSSLQTRQFFDSRATKLENQLSDVVHNEEEMKGSLKKSAGEIKQHPVYADWFRKAYPADKEPVSEYNIANAISSFVRSLISLNSRFDQYMRGDEKKLNVSEKAGFNLFSGKAKCATCHFIPLFSGLVPPEFTETESEVLGVPSGKDTLDAQLDPDKGKFNFTRAIIHQFAFKTPTLRNIELTSPYMHNGVFDTLEEVMDFYNRGGGSGLKIAPSNQTLPPGQLGLTKKEIGQIISFMKTLTDTSSAGYR